MKIALSSYSAMGAWFVLRLSLEGHKVTYFLSNEDHKDVLGGLINPPKIVEIDQRRHIQGYGFPSYKGFDLSLFDLTGRAKQAEHSRMECPTLGDGALEHMLEDDREFGISFMESCGIEVPPYSRFDNPAEAKEFLKTNNKRYVYKPFTVGNTGQDNATTYVSKNAEDMLTYIDRLFEISKNAPFILQEFIEGAEIGTEAFFNGKDFYMLTGTIEEKKFMNDNKGPNTGCSGNLVFAMRDDAKIYKDGLLKAKEKLSMIGFRGILDLNTIVTKDKAYGLEWTPRFGYLCCPTISAMYGNGYGELLYDIATGSSPDIKWSDKFAFATMLTIPPYPTEIRIPKAKDVPVEGIDVQDPEELAEMYLYDVMLQKNKLITSGNYGYIGAAISTGGTISQAHEKMKTKLDRIQIPNCQYRTDIYQSTMKRYNALEEGDWL